MTTTTRASRRASAHVSPLGIRKPLAGYRRLTVDRYGNKIGFDIQTDQITAIAASQGETIGEWYEDRDLTAADLSVKRPGYERMLADIQAGKWGGIAVWRLDRLVRLTREFERCWSIVEDTGGMILSCTNPLASTRDQTGLIFMRLLVMFAEMEIDGMRIRATAHQQRKRETGKYKGGGKRAFGFEGASKGHDSECADPDRCKGCGPILNPGRIGIAHVPTEVALIREAADRIINLNQSPTTVLKDWAKRDVRGSTGSLFNGTTLMNVLTSPRIAGLREYTTVDEETGEERTVFVKAEWDAILDRDTWEKLRAMRKGQVKRGRPHEYLLTGGGVICDQCERPLIANVSYPKKDEPGIRGYRCDPSPNAKAAGACGRVYVYAKPVDDLVIAEALRRAHASREIFDALRAQVEAQRHTAIEGALAELKECDDELVWLAHRRGTRQITPAEWEAMREPVARRRDEALMLVEAARAAQSTPVPMGRDWDDLKAWFVPLMIEQKRAFIRLLLREPVRIRPAASRGGGSGKGVSFDDSRVCIPADAENVDDRGQA